MNTIPREQLVNQLNWRDATKQFDPQHKLIPEDVATHAEALELTPSGTAPSFEGFKR